MTYIATDLTGYTKISTGSYTGNDTVNRAIAHGLGVNPKLILFSRVSLGYNYKIAIPGELTYLDEGGNSAYALTTWTTTNFYVGNATQYAKSANGNTFVYHWVALA